MRQLSAQLLLGLTVLLQGCVHFNPLGAEPVVRDQSPVDYVALPANDSTVLETAHLPGKGTSCADTNVKTQMLRADDVLWLALCNDPRTHQRWAELQGAVAQLGLGYSAYLPTLNASVSYSNGHAQEQFPDLTALNENSHVDQKEAELNFNWVLFDGGARSGNVETARQQVLAAQAMQDETLLTVFSNVMQQYFKVITANSAVDAARQSQQAAKSSYDVAVGRNKGGVAPIADVLQAQSAFSQSTYDLIQAEGDLEAQKGQLAIDMGQKADFSYSLAPPDTALPSMAELQTIDRLIALAEEKHPSIAAAAATVRANEAQLDVAAATGMPVIALTGNLQGGRDVGDIGSPLRNYHAQDVIGIRLTIPLFDNLSRGYQLQAAHAAIDTAKAQLQAAELNVSLDVWKNYQALKTGVQAFKTANDLLSIAQIAHAVAEGRYQNGIGSIIELLNTQITLSTAQQQVIRARSDSLSSRVALTASLGMLDLQGQR